MGAVNPPSPLEAEDDLGGFDSGRPSLNRWLRERAWRNQQTGAARTYVLTRVDDGRIVGYMSLCSGSIERSALGNKDRRNAPDPMPVLLLAQLAIDQRDQGRGYGRDLLRYALRLALESSARIGSFGLITHPVDDAARAFYARWGFQVLPRDERGAMIIRLADLRASLVGD